MAQHYQPREMACALSIGAIAASWSAEGMAWSPDVADDMARRCLDMVKEALAEAASYGLLQTDSEVIFDDGTMAETGADEDGE